MNVQAINNPKDYDRVIDEIISKVTGDVVNKAHADLTEVFELVKDPYLKETNKTITGKKGEAYKIAYFAYILDTARIIAFNMRGSSSDVITCLLSPAYIHKMISASSIYKFSKHSDRIRKFEAAVLRDSSNKNKSRDEIDNILLSLIHEHVADKLFEDIKRKTSMSRIPQAYLINNAYEMAKAAHRGTYRESGEPYIIHPLIVAEILAETGAESSIIAAAILHDVIEESDFTSKDIEKKTNRIVAELVDAVTSIEKEYEDIIKADPDSSFAGLDKTGYDQATILKLINKISKSENLIFALYIKAADRVHNLKTMEAMPDDKREAKVFETRQYYIPVFEKYRLNKFVPEIENLCWRVSKTSSELYHFYEAEYQRLLMENSSATSKMCDILRSTFQNIPAAEFSSRFNCKPFDIELKIREYTPYEVYKMLMSKEDSDHDNDPVPPSKHNIPLFSLEIIMYDRDDEHDISSFIPIFIEKYRDELIQEGLTIMDYGVRFFDGEGNYSIFIDLQDIYCNTVRLRCHTVDVYNRWMYGMFRGYVDTERLITDPENISVSNVKEIIYVKKRNGESMPLPKGSTVLDFAFSLHEDIGLTAKAATVNKQQVSIFKELNQGDKVVVIADSGRGDSASKKIVFHARIDWLHHVKTQKAKRSLVKYLQFKYKEDNPTEIYKARSLVVTYVSDHIYEGIAEKMGSITYE